MFTHDPFQSYQTLGAIGQGTPYGLPFTGIQPSPFALQSFGNPAIGLGYGQYPQQQLQQNPFQQNPFQQLQQNPYQQLQQNPYQQLQAPWNPLASGLQNPTLHHQLAQLQHQALQNQALQNQALQNQALQNQALQNQALQNPSLQNPLMNPMLAYQAWQQQFSPLQYPLAPQSFIGGQGIGQPYGQIHPLQQLALRGGGYGPNPYAGY